jgi:hypothetical protein
MQWKANINRELEDVIQGEAAWRLILDGKTWNSLTIFIEILLKSEFSQVLIHVIGD